MTMEKRRRRLIFNWTAPKGFTAITLFSALALVVEYALVSFFTSFGLTDKNTLTTPFRFPLTQSIFAINISPLFHLTPLGVIVVLVSSWIYLTKYTAIAPRAAKPIKKPQKIPRKKLSKKLGARFRKVSYSLKSFHRRLNTAVLRVRGISYVVRRLSFARTAVKSALVVMAIFLTFFLALYILAYPRSPYDAVIGLYRFSPSLLGFVSKTIEIAQGIARVFSPIGWLGSAINEALFAAAPGFKRALDNFGAATTDQLPRLDLMGRYVLCQNLAAWASAIIAFAYGQYVSHLHLRKSR